MPHRVVVEVNEDLGDLIPGFLAHKRADVSTILRAIARRDYAEIARVAHRIKGDGGSYGFDTIAELGRSLEAAASARNDGAVITLVRQLLNYIDDVEIVLQPADD